METVVLNYLASEMGQYDAFLIGVHTPVLQSLLIDFGASEYRK